jgi:Fe-S-cluster containining protein
VGRPVPLTGFDVNRLSDALGVPWDELAVAGVAFTGGFRLDGSSTRWGFRLRQHPDTRCLLTVGGEYLRCAAHEARPSACRVYPLYIGLRDDGVRVGMGNNAACPPVAALGWSELAAPELVEAEIAEHHRYQERIERWEAELTEKRSIEDFLAFVRA